MRGQRTKDHPLRSTWLVMRLMEGFELEIEVAPTVRSVDSVLYSTTVPTVLYDTDYLGPS